MANLKDSSANRIVRGKIELRLAINLLLPFWLSLTADISSTIQITLDFLINSSTDIKLYVSKTNLAICSSILELFIFAPSTSIGNNPKERASRQIFLARVVLPDCSSPKIRIRLSYSSSFSPEIFDEIPSNDSFITFKLGKTNKSFREIVSRFRCANFIPVSSRKSLNLFENSIFEFEVVLKLLKWCSLEFKESVFF